MEPTVRLDSLDPQRGPRSFRFEGLRAIVRADAVDEVIPALRVVEEAVADGLHAAGFVSYEAAPAFDPALATRDADARIPLLWFALFERRIEADRDELSEETGDASLGELRADVEEEDYAARVGGVDGLAWRRVGVATGWKPAAGTARSPPSRTMPRPWCVPQPAMRRLSPHGGSQGG